MYSQSPNKLAPSIQVGQIIQYSHKEIEMAGIVSKVEDSTAGLLCLHICIPPGPGPFVGLGPVVTLQHIPYDPGGSHRSWHFLDEGQPLAERAKGESKAK